MDFTNIKDLFRQSAEFAGKEITVGGWVKNNRASKAFAQGINIRLGILCAKTDAQAAIRLLRCQTKRSKRTRGGFAV